MVILSLVALCVFSLIASLGQFDSSRTTAALLFSLGITTLIPLARWRNRAQVDLCETIYVVAFGYLVYFVLSYIRVEQDVSLFPTEWVIPAYINKALLYTGAGFSMLLIGYYSPLGTLTAQRLPRLRLSAYPSQAHRMIYLLYLAGTVVRLLLLARGTGTWSTKAFEVETGEQLSGLAYSLAYLSNLALFAYLIAMAHFFSEGRTRTLAFALWGIMLPAECFWVFLQGSKGLFIPVLAAPWIAHNYLRKRVGFRQLLLPLVIVVFVIFPVITEYRNWAHEYPIRLQTLPADLPKITRNLLDGLFHPQSETQPMGGLDLAAQRSVGTLLVSNVIRYVEEHGIIRGETLWQGFLILIPTVFLPEKSAYLGYASQLYGEDIMGLHGTVSGIAVMQVGEFYLNFGLMGILIGMFLQGILYRCWQEYWVGMKTPLAIALFLLGWRWLVFIEYPIAPAYGQILRELLLMIPIVWLITRRKPAEPMAR